MDGQLLGDPIELAALHAIGWGYAADTGVAQADDQVPAAEKAVREAETRLKEAQRAAGAAAGGDAARAAQAAVGARQAGDALEQATRAKARAERRRESAAQRGLVVRPVQRRRSPPPRCVSPHAPLLITPRCSATTSRRHSSG